jgi:predicted nucleic acid-binding Zn ribbon protein
MWRHCLSYREERKVRVAIYGFKCQICFKEIDLEFPIGTAPSTSTCSQNNCEGQMTRVYTANPAIFKGTGWAGKR